MAEAALAGGLDKGTRGDRYQVVVHVDAPVLEEPVDVPAGTSQNPGSDPADVPAGTSAQPEPRDGRIVAFPALGTRGNVPAGTPRGKPGGQGQSAFEGGGNVPAETSRRIACDAGKVVMTHDPDGNILDLGRRTRIISPALRRALTHRDQGCRFPGCGLKFCDAHHVRHWAQGGETRLDNLVLLCRKHHRSVHEEEYRIRCASDGELRFLRPDGRPLTESPPLPAVPDDALAALAESLIEAGVDLAEIGAYPEWDGSALDLGWAVDAFALR